MTWRGSAQTGGGAELMTRAEQADVVERIHVFQLDMLEEQVKALGS